MLFINFQIDGTRTKNENTPSTLLYIRQLKFFTIQDTSLCLVSVSHIVYITCFSTVSRLWTYYYSLVSSLLSLQVHLNVLVPGAPPSFYPYGLLEFLVAMTSGSMYKSLTTPSRVSIPFPCKDLMCLFLRNGPVWNQSKDLEEDPGLHTKEHFMSKPFIRTVQSNRS